MVVVRCEGFSIGGAVKGDSKSFGMRAITIARPPSVIDQSVG